MPRKKTTVLGPLSEQQRKDAIKYAEKMAGPSDATSSDPADFIELALLETDAELQESLQTITRLRGKPKELSGEMVDNGKSSIVRMGDDHPMKKLEREFADDMVQQDRHWRGN